MRNHCRARLGALEDILHKYQHGRWLKSIPAQMWALISGSADCHHSARTDIGVSHLATHLQRHRFSQRCIQVKVASCASNSKDVVAVVSPLLKIFLIEAPPIEALHCSLRLSRSRNVPVKPLLLRCIEWHRGISNSQ